MVLRLRTVATRCLHLCCVRQRKFESIGQDLPSFVANLLGPLHFSVSSNAEYLRLEHVVNGWLASSASKLQAAFYKVLIEPGESDWHSLLHRRLCEISTDTNGDCVVAASNELTLLTCFVIQTIFNPWSTSTRYHRTRPLPYVFGCSWSNPLLTSRRVRDDVRHYLECPFL